MSAWLNPLRKRFPVAASLIAPVATFGCLGLTGVVTVAGAVGAGFLIGHTALTVMMPVALAALAWGYIRHRQPLALTAGTGAFGVAYLHVFGGTPDWTLAFVLILSLVAGAADWRASRRVGACHWRGGLGSADVDEQPLAAGA